MRVSLKAVPGVESVDVSLEKGLAVVKMKPGNTATLKQLSDAISKNGFTMKDAAATVAGMVMEANGRTVLRVSGSDDVLTMVADGAAPNPTAETGKLVVLTGIVPEAVKGKGPDTIRYRSISEEGSK